MKKLSIFLAIAMTILVFYNPSNGQVSMGNGSYMTGYGQVYGSLGYGMSVQNSYLATQNLLYSLRKKSAGKGGSSSSASNGSSSGNQASPQTYNAPKNYGKFRPDASVNVAKTLGDLFEKPNERRQMTAVVEEVQKIYKQEAAARGWGNNVAGGMTFFMVVMSTVYHDTNQPKDETIKLIFDAVNQSLDADPNFAEAKNADKAKLNDLLVGFTALPFLTYVEGKKEGNAETVKIARTLAGEMIKMVLKTDPKNVKFNDKDFVIEK